MLLKKLNLENSGAFLVGLVVPREGGLSITLTEKLEDMVSIVFLPLVCAVRIVAHYTHFGQYFALSGLNTNLGLLDDGWWCSQSLFHVLE